MATSASAEKRSFIEWVSNACNVSKPDITDSEVKVRYAFIAVGRGVLDDRPQLAGGCLSDKFRIADLHRISIDSTGR